ncbi:RloB domain-containing protein [Clavibacter zhangzhiyongii]|uniref:RloB domain-containing protein n=1 Tax=Clavibacter zhangzhiyongii TaxID=2768071 RepID=A0A7L7Z1D2_9MICO|nr:RloB domain-containing protein [Clavibacter zhangzhiyongii]
MVTEAQYIQGLAQYLRTSGVSIRTPLLKGIGRDPYSVLQATVKLRESDAEGFDETFALVDVDDHETLDKCLESSGAASVGVIVSNPCFEIWLLWHYRDHNRNDSTSAVQAALKHEGHEQKAIPTKFPYEKYVDAVERADKRNRKMVTSHAGQNPGSSMPRLIEAMILNAQG